MKILHKICSYIMEEEYRIYVMSVIFTANGDTDHLYLK